MQRPHLIHFPLSTTILPTILCTFGLLIFMREGKGKDTMESETQPKKKPITVPDTERGCALPVMKGKIS